MKVKIYLSDTSQLEWENFEPETALDLKADLQRSAPGSLMTFDMDGATVLVNRDHIVRIDFETGVEGD